VLDEKDYSLDGKDRDEWDRLWGARTQRLLPCECKLNLDSYLPSLRLTAITIADDPAEFAFAGRVYRGSEVCPICGRLTTGSVRVAASLDLTFEGGLSLGLGVWAHQGCFDACFDTGKPAHIPW
jgi:hypothetical protein